MQSERTSSPTLCGDCGSSQQMQDTEFFVLFCKAHLLLKSMSIGLLNVSCSLGLSFHYLRLTHVVSVETRVQTSHHLRQSVAIAAHLRTTEHPVTSALPQCISKSQNIFSVD